MRKDHTLEFQHLLGEVLARQRGAGRMISGACKARYETGAFGVMDRNHDDGQGWDELLRRADGGDRIGEDDGHAGLRQFERQLRKPLIMSRCKSRFENVVAALEQAIILQSSFDRPDLVGAVERRGRAVRQNPDAGRSLLRTRHIRPRSRGATESCQEMTPPHSHQMHPSKSILACRPVVRWRGRDFKVKPMIEWLIDQFEVPPLLGIGAKARGFHLGFQYLTVLLGYPSRLCGTSEPIQTVIPGAEIDGAILESFAFGRRAWPEGRQGIGWRQRKTVWDDAEIYRASTRMT